MRDTPTDTPRRELLWQLRTTLADADPAKPALGLTDDAQRAIGASLLISAACIWCMAVV